MFNKHYIQPGLLVALATLGLLLSGIATGRVSAGRSPTLQSTTILGGKAAPSCDFITRFDPKHFSNPTTIDNKWLPLVPGTEFTLKGSANWGGGVLPHRVLFTVTDLTKIIDGVRTIVIWERDINAGQLLESEIAFHAQDNDGSVWLFGEYPEEYKNGKFIGAPSTWIAGQAHAEAGILMPANPRIRTPSYLQGLAPEIDFVDCARVLKKEPKSCIPLHCYDQVVVTDEWNPRFPDDGHQQKYYAPGVGNIRADFVGGPEHETLLLVKVAHLDQRGLAEVRNQALKLDAHAYEVSELYGHTLPAGWSEYR
jgi:hypothetical protein